MKERITRVTQWAVLSLRAFQDNLSMDFAGRKQ